MKGRKGGERREQSKGKTRGAELWRRVEWWVGERATRCGSQTRCDRTRGDLGGLEAWE